MMILEYLWKNDRLFSDIINITSRSDFQAQDRFDTERVSRKRRMHRLENADVRRRIDRESIR